MSLILLTSKRRSYLEGKKESEKLGENRTQKTTQKTIEAITKKSDITQKELATIIGITDFYEFSKIIWYTLAE